MVIHECDIASVVPELLGSPFFVSRFPFSICKICVGVICSVSHSVSGGVGMSNILSLV